MMMYRKFLILFLALTILIAGLGVSVQTAQAANCTQYHLVKPGDTLLRIARFYGLSWKTLAEWNHLKNPNLIYSGTWLCVSITPKPPKPKVVPTFSIIGVVRNTSVTIRTANFPANDTFNVYMNTYGTKGINGIKVGTLASGDGGKLDATFTIPAALKGYWRIAIRLQSPTSGYFAYNWFYNNTTK